MKGKEYYHEGESFPTVGDFVLIERIYEGDTEVIKTFKGEYLASYTWANFIEADMRFKREKL